VFRTHWIQGINGDWYKYTSPVSLQIELSLITSLKKASEWGDLVTQIVSEVLNLPPNIIEDDLLSEQVLDIFKNVFPSVDSHASQKVESVQLEFEGKGTSIEDSLTKMLAFLSRYGNVQPSEVLRLPRATVESLLREITELLEVDKKFEFETSVVHALSLIFGDGGSTSSSSGSSVRKDRSTVDLSNLDDVDLSVLGSIDGVEVRKHG